jgi:hypothetical protein
MLLDSFAPIYYFSVPQVAGEEKRPVTILGHARVALPLEALLDKMRY